MKETWLKTSKQVCGMTKGPPRHKETLWWNRHVTNVVAKRKVCHKAWRKSKSAEDKHTLDVAKKEVYTTVLAAQESKLQEFTADLQSESGRRFQRQHPSSGGTVRSSDLQIVVNTSLQTVSSTVFRTRVSLQRLS